MSIVGTLGVILLLVAVNGVFVAAEFSILGVSRHRLELKAQTGHFFARNVLGVLQNPVQQDRYIATAQLGITIASLGLGMYAEESIAEWIYHPLVRLGLMQGLGLEQVLGWSESAVAHTIATALTLLLITYMHVVFGEMIPKSLALAHADSVVIGLAPIMMLASFVGFFPIYLLNGLGNLLLRSLRISVSTIHGAVHSPEELQIVVQESAEGGLLGEEYGDLFRNLLDLTERTVHQIMVPRTEIVGIARDMPVTELLSFIDEAGHTRYPVYDGDLDHVVGVIHVKDALRRALEPPREIALAAIMQPPLFVPESISAMRLLNRMREARMHMAVVLDEFGGTAGLVCFENVLEEVVGEVRDEFDEEELEPITKDGASYLLQGDVLLEKLNEMLDLDFPAEEIDTIGGLVLDHLGRPADVGDQFETGGAYLEVLALRGRGVARVRLTPLVPEGEDVAETAAKNGETDVPKRD